MLGPNLGFEKKKERNVMHKPIQSYAVLFSVSEKEERKEKKIKKKEERKEIGYKTKKMPRCTKPPMIFCSKYQC